MSDEVKKGRGRPNFYGKNLENTKNIATDLKKIQNGDDLSIHYVNKLVDLGFAKVVLTNKGDEFLAANPE